jgi:hypothetical protein
MYTNKEEADAARIVLSKGEAVHKVPSQALLFAISESMTEAYGKVQSLTNGCAWNAVSAFRQLRTCRRTRPGQLWWQKRSADGLPQSDLTWPNLKKLTSPPSAFSLLKI